MLKGKCNRYVFCGKKDAKGLPLTAMEIPSKYAPREVEKQWYQAWLDQKAFASKPDNRPAYTIVIPPPNVTGVLHMGHMLNVTIQDVLVRRARMKGFNACWVPGTDHASIATEAKVVQKLRESGVKKSDLSREEFLEHAWEWTHKHGGIILEQLKELGASCDWDRTTFTLDPIRSESVLKAFNTLHKQGHVYRGLRMVNWDPEAQTSISDEEVIHKDVDRQLYHVRYAIPSKPGTYVTVATTRPETIMGDTAIAVHPDDARYASLVGLEAELPIGGRLIPIISDDYIDIDFGTGALKVTPAHDVNDHAIGEKHGLEVIDIFHADATLNSHGLVYEGMDRFVARKAVLKDLKASGALVKTEPYQSSIGTSERTGAVVEPRLSLQWFVRMPELAKPALDAVLNDDVALVPKKFLNTYKHWMENVRDWCISRQLWWGHQIPVWYYGDGESDYVVAMDADSALLAAQQATSNNALTMADIKQDPDCLDTWFSSWLWPLSVFDGIRNPDNEEINYYYPTADLVTAPEILFFWVARMIMAGTHFRNEKPFSTVYLTGIVRDKQGRKMSKSLGNSPDPIGLMDIYGADGVRMGMLLTSPAGNDLPFDEDLCAQGRNFTNKVWNALRLVKGWDVDESVNDEASMWAVNWFKGHLSLELKDLEKDFERYALSEALMRLYKLIWQDFCAWYLELIKPAYNKPMHPDVMAATLDIFDTLMTALHPFTPFLTEEVWHRLRDGRVGELLTLASFPEQTTAEDLSHEFAQLEAHVVALRQFRNNKGMPQKVAMGVAMDVVPVAWAGIAKLTHAVIDQSDAGIPLRVGTVEIRVHTADAVIDIEAEKAKLDKDIAYNQGFMRSVQAKLSNERFIASAPDKVIDIEKRKLADAKAKLEVAVSQRAALD